MTGAGARASRRRVNVALVMPARNEEAAVDMTLEAVFASSRLPDEILIADGMSTDRTVERIKRFEGRGVPLRILSNPSRFSGGGRNLGIRHATSEIILLADFGNVMDRDWIEEMVRPFEELDGVEMVAGLHRPLVTSDFEHCVAAIQYHEQCMLAHYTPAERESLLGRSVIPGGASLGLTRATWERVGGYPEWLPRAQDRLFSRKAWAVGVRIEVNWRACTSHHMRRSPAEVFRQTLSYGRGNGRSRCADRQIFKLGGFYALLVAAGAGTVISWWCLALAGVLGAAYLYRRGLRRLIRVDGGLRRLGYLVFVPGVVVAADVGSLVGHLLGWLEWWCIPRYRRLFFAYTTGCTPLPVLQ